MKKTWWKEAVVYQIYPRSFQDSDGDGIGDFTGIKRRIPYLKKLGADIIWMCPCYASPCDDNGYDISDYCAVLPEFGTMEDFNALLAELHANGMKLVMDLVVNHTSDEHPWFVQSRSSKDNPYRNYYIWREGRDGKEPNNWGSHFSPSAWTYDSATQEYYLHLFSKKQPDLNWENPKVRAEVCNIMRFWLDKGVDGFRMDVINMVKKPEGLPNSTLAPTCAEGFSFDNVLYSNNVGLTAFLQELKHQVLDRYNCMTVGETAAVTPELALLYVNETDGPLDMVFHFQIVDLREHFTWGKFKALQRTWAKNLWGKGWSSQFLQNHDQPRCVSVYGNDGQYRKESAKMLGTLLHTLPGTPYVYQGEELGLTNTPFASIEQLRDINGIFDYEKMCKLGKTPAQALAYLNHYSRDHSRTPMPWDASENGGFTQGSPWICMNPRDEKIHATAQEADETSVLHYYRRLIALRKAHASMVYGEFEEYEPEREDVYCYARRTEEQTLWVVANLTPKMAALTLPFAPAQVSLLLHNYATATLTESLSLRPYEALVLCENHSAT